jgi:hypothetical protein
MSKLDLEYRHKRQCQFYTALRVVGFLAPSLERWALQPSDPNRKEKQKNVHPMQ